MVAANRDEFRDRPAEGPAIHAHRTAGGAGAPGRILAPRDRRAGGTWLGLNASGLFAAVTNRRCEEPDPRRRSRGWLVLDALEEATAGAAADRLERLPPEAYNPFNLFVADSETAHLITYADRTLRVDLAPGAHVIGNAHPMDEASPKLERLRRDVAQVVAGEASLLDRLAGVCRAHVPGDPLRSTCVHADEYGTCSSTLLRLGAEPALRYAPGPPCETRYRDLTPLLDDMGLVPRSEGVQA